MSRGTYAQQFLEVLSLEQALPCLRQIFGALGTV